MSHFNVCCKFSPVIQCLLRLSCQSEWGLRLKEMLLKRASNDIMRQPLTPHIFSGRRAHNFLFRMCLLKYGQYVSDFHAYFYLYLCFLAISFVRNVSILIAGFLFLFAVRLSTIRMPRGFNWNLSGYLVACTSVLAISGFLFFVHPYYVTEKLVLFAWRICSYYQL